MVRNLYVEGVMVDQPIYTDEDGVEHKLKRWIHNDEVVWENGVKITGMLANLSQGACILDWTDKNNIKLYRRSTVAHYVTNEKIAMAFIQSYSYFNISNDFFNWTRLDIQDKQYTSDAIHSAIPTKYGFLYMRQLKAGTTSYGYELWHCSIDAEKLEIIKDVKIRDIENSTNYFLGNNGTFVPRGEVDLEHFWKGARTSSSVSDEVEVYSYTTSKDSLGREYVDGIKRLHSWTIPYGGSTLYCRLLPNNVVITNKRIFDYGGFSYEQLLGLTLLGGEIELTEYFSKECMTVGEFLDERAKIGGGTVEEIAERRANLKTRLANDYPFTFTNESIKIVRNDKKDDICPQGGAGDKISFGNNPIEIVLQGNDESKISGFLGQNEDGSIRTNYRFPIYSYNSTQKRYIFNNKYLNIHDGSHPVDGDTNTSSGVMTKYADGVSVDDKGKLNYSDNLFYVNNYGSYHAIFRHKKDISKSFAINCSNGNLSSSIPIDLPPEYFE